MWGSAAISLLALILSGCANVFVYVPIDDFQRCETGCEAHNVPVARLFLDEGVQLLSSVKQSPNSGQMVCWLALKVPAGVRVKFLSTNLHMEVQGRIVRVIYMERDDLTPIPARRNLNQPLRSNFSATLQVPMENWPEQPVLRFPPLEINERQVEPPVISLQRESRGLFVRLQ